MSVKVPKVRLNKRGNVYWYSFFYKGIRYRGTTKTGDEKQALAYGEQQLAALVREEATDAIENRAGTLPSSVVFNHYREKLQLMGRTEGTLANYKRYAEKFKEFFKDKPLSHLTRFSVEGWRDWLLNQPVKCHGWEKSNGTYSKKLVSEHLAWLGTIFNYYGLESPLNKVEFPKKSQAEIVEELQFYNRDEMKALFETTKKLYDEEEAKTPIVETEEDGTPIYEDNLFGEWKEFYLWFRLMAWTGIRLGEMQGIRFKDVDQRRQMILVYSQKTKKRRGLGLLSEDQLGSWNVVDILQELAYVFYRRIGYGQDAKTKREWMGKHSEKVLYTRYANWFYKTLARVCKVAKVPFKGVHAIRHTFASEWLGKWDIAALAKWLGHKNIQITYDTYGHLINQRVPKLWTE